MKNSKQILLSLIGISLLSISVYGIANSQNSKKPTQKIIPAPVNYWADISNGGNGLFPDLPFGMGESKNTRFGDAHHGSQGKHVDIAIFHKDFPRSINAIQTLPKDAKLKSINLIPSPVEKTNAKPVYKEKYDKPYEQGEMKDFTMKFYWGCGANVKAGQPKIFQIKNGQMTNALDNIGSRTDKEKGAHSNDAASRWPNQQDQRSFGDANLLGLHTIKGTNIPSSLGFTLNSVQSFMPNLGLKTSGDKSGIVTASWNNIGAKGYFLTGMGTSEGLGVNSGSELIIWSASDLPDNGYGLMGYLSSNNLNKFLSEKVILPATQTTCQIPSGIFSKTQMIMLKGIGYGEETNIIYPERPKDVSLPWIQEWSAKIRNKSTDTLMLGMANMDSEVRVGSSRQDEAKPSETADQKRIRECKEAQARAENTGSSVGKELGSALGGWKGAAVGGVLGGLSGKKAVKEKCE